MPSSYLVMPFMQTDLQKIMGMEFSEEKIQYLVYQMLKGLKVGGELEGGRRDALLSRPEVWGRLEGPHCYRSEEVSEPA